MKRSRGRRRNIRSRNRSRRRTSRRKTKRINRTYLDIYNFIDSIDKLSLSQKRQITIPLIKELL